MRIDIDLAPSKRRLILQKMREECGELNVVQVATFGVAAPKAAITTACRGYRSKEYPKGIDVDTAQYLTGLVPVERGITRSIHDCLYGNEEKDIKPIDVLVKEIDKYEGLREIIEKVEGVILRRGQHASGVMVYNNSPYETGALMRSPNGDITTQYDLHMAEKCGDTKFDYLVTEITDKISIAIDMLMKDGYFKDCTTKKEIYNRYFHPEIIDYSDNRIWDALCEGNVQDVFQFSTDVGAAGIKAIQPRSVTEVTATNALIRLSAPEGQERPMDRYVRFKNNISLWYNEMDKAGLTKEEQKSLEPYYLDDYGVPCSQEALMRMVMDKNISGFTLAESNETRKVLAKKQVKKIPIVKEKFLKQCPNSRLGNYAWETMMLPQMSYSFSVNHATPYSIVGIQTVMLSALYPSVYWNCACLIVNSQSILDEDDNIDEEDLVSVDSSVNEEEDIEDEDDEEEEKTKGKEKVKNKTPNYGKVATAMGKMKSNGVKIVAPDVNKSSYTYTPDAETNSIVCGFRGITRVSNEIIKEIIINRPYTSVEDFFDKIKITKLPALNLIKSGAFDNLNNNREEVMFNYLESKADTKNRLTLQNMRALVEYEIIPDDMAFYGQLFNFNKALKAVKYQLNDKMIGFILDKCDGDLIDGSKVDSKTWDKWYKKAMDPMRDWLKENQKEALDNLNKKIVDELVEKYAKGTISKWEMDSISFYYHDHELESFKNDFSDFFKMPEKPIPEYSFISKDGKEISVYNPVFIAGTVLDKNKLKNSVTILTNTGVVTVKVWKNQFADYNRRISYYDDSGKKHVLENSWFTKGNLLMFQGVRQGDSFILKKTKKSIYPVITKINIINNELHFITEREDAQ